MCDPSVQRDQLQKERVAGTYLNAKKDIFKVGGRF
jgi:hypothetical protein